jgi:hypothetical protein
MPPSSSLTFTPPTLTKSQSWPNFFSISLVSVFLSFLYFCSVISVLLSFKKNKKANFIYDTFLRPFILILIFTSTFIILSWLGNGTGKPTVITPATYTRFMAYSYPQPHGFTRQREPKNIQNSPE